MDAAELISTFDDTQELRDASVTLWIHSGIRVVASDAQRVPELGGA